MEIRNTRTNPGRDAWIMNLPQEIIFDIWCRLPIESVLRCMSVCKLWYSLRHDSIFIDLHLSQSMLYQPPRLVLGLPPTAPSDYNKMSSLLMVNCEGDCKTRQIPMGLDLDERWSFEIVGSCNGFLCIAGREYGSPIYLYSPITRESMTLPKSKLVLPDRFFISVNTTVGFGFDKFSDKYKVVRVYEIFPFKYIESDDEEYESHYNPYGQKEKKANRFAEIITVGEKSSWRKLYIPRSIQIHDGIDPVFLDGMLYWLICEKPYSPDLGCILALDLDSEKFWIAKCPPPRDDFRQRNSLILIDGSVAIIDYAYKIPKSVDIWLLQGSKTTGFSFNLTTYDMSRLIYRDFLVMAKLGHDTFLLELRSVPLIRNRIPESYEYSLLLYSPVKHFFIQGIWKTCKLRRHWMMPTLKSLKALSWTDEEDSEGIWCQKLGSDYSEDGWMTRNAVPRTMA